MSRLDDNFVLDMLVSGEFIIASDGSAPDKASSSWILSTKQGFRTVFCDGPAFGAKPGSFRAEAYAILSALRFVHHFLQYMGAYSAAPYLHLTDCKSLIQRIASAYKHEDYYANATLAAEWDIVNEIVVNLRLLEHPPEIRHIKGHQDQHKPYDQLPLHAQLNCDADTLANESLRLRDPRLDCSRVPLLPHAGAQLHLPQGTITGKIKKPIIKASRGPALLEHIRTTNGWDHTTLDLVDWDSHGIVRRSISHEVTMVKFLFGILPVGARTTKYHPKYSELCATCGVEKETIEHFHQCPAHSRKKSNKVMLVDLRKKAESLNTRPPLIQIMLDGISNYLNGSDHLNPLAVGPHYRELVRQQNRIGWLNFLRGRWSLEWTRLQVLYFRPESGRGQWATQLIKTLWDSIYKTWEQRNDDLHGTDAATQAKADRVVYQREIQMYYDAQWMYSEEIQHVFDTPVEKLMKQKNYQLTNWINLYGPVLELDLDSQESNS